ncbi:Proliferating cell nuclear antigen [Hordeum vulgare]|nr:Proliferating cell nuclear antigen [Hordeum vulgare]
MELVTDANFDCSGTGFSLQAMDSSHVTLVTLLLRSEGFEHYRCDRNLSMGMNLGNMAKMLRCAGSNDIITIKADDGSDTVTSMFESSNIHSRLMHTIESMFHIESSQWVPAYDYDRDLVVEPMSTTGSTQPSRPDIRSSPSASSENVRARNSGSSFRSAAPPPAAAQAGAANPLRFDARTIHFSVTAWVLVVAGLGMLPILPKHLADRACKLSLLGTVLSSGYSLYSTYGKPRELNMPAIQSWLESVLGAKDFIHLMFSLLLVTSQLHLKIAALPVFCWALDHVARFLRRNFSRLSFYRGYLEEPCLWVETNNTSLSLLSSNAELALGFLLIISLFSWWRNFMQTFIYWNMATFIPVKFTEFCQPDATMPFGKELVQITKDLRIALPTITGKPTSSYPEDSRYRIEVHVPGRTFEPRTEPVDFKFIAPNWILGRDMAVHCALGRIKEVYRGCPISPDLFTVSRRREDGEIISSKTKDALLSYAQTLEKHSGTLEHRVIKDARKIKQLSLRELELEEAAREAHYEHELEVKDFLERIEKLKTRVAYLEEELDMGENLHPEGDVAPLISNDEDYEESSTEGPTTMLF